MVDAFLRASIEAQREIASVSANPLSIIFSG